MTALKQKTGKKGDWFGSPTPCLSEAPPLPGGTALVSNVGLQQTLEYSKKIVIFQEIQTGHN